MAGGLQEQQCLDGRGEIIQTEACDGWSPKNFTEAHINRVDCKEWEQILLPLAVGI